MGWMMNRIARSFLIGTMAFVLLALTPLSAQASQALTRVEHPNVLVTIDPEASSQNEVTIAAFPNDRKRTRGDRARYAADERLLVGRVLPIDGRRRHVAERSRTGLPGGHLPRGTLIARA